MKSIYKFLLGLFVLCLTGCMDESTQNNEYGNGDKGLVTFNISAPDLRIEVTSRANVEDTVRVIKDLKWLITDPEGNVVDHYYGRLDDGFTKLTLEGLKYGDYNLLLLATLAEGKESSYGTPVSESDSWLQNKENDGQPLDGLYCYKRLPFTLNGENLNMDVIMEHAVSRVYVDVNIPNESMWRHVKKVSVTFKNEVPSSLNAGGNYTGTELVKDYPIYDPSGVFTFTTFPSDKPVSGYVDIESTRDGGENFVQRYEFSDLKLEAGKIARIKLEYRHPERETGLLRVTGDELWRFNPSTMFMADEPREVFYNNSIRSFYANEPLQVWVTPEGKLGVKFYSPIPIKNVKVHGVFNKLTTEPVEIALLEEVKPFMECYFDLPVCDHECIFDGVTGRKVKIPAQPNLKPADLSITFECDDPFMQKIASIDSHWYIRFSPYQADSGHAYWRHMDPLLCRHGVALALNMAFMFASEDFNEELQKYDGILYDNGGNAINLDNLRSNIRNHGGLALGRVVGVGGLGGGQTYGLADYCYTGVYHNNTAVGSNPHNYPRQAMFHEYGHCLGYNHSSNMTYGDCWTVICAKVFVEMGRAGKLPVSDITDVTDLPMN